MKKLLAAFSAAILAFTLASCGTQKQSVSVEAMDTFMKIEYYGDESVGEKLTGEIKRLDSLFSVTDKNSEVYALNRDKEVKPSDDLSALLKRSLTLCDRLDGALDVTILPVVEKWGFLNGKYRVPDKQEIQSALKAVNYKNIEVDNDKVKLKNNAKLDLGAVAKGYAADKCLEILSDNNVETSLLNLGGTIAVHGRKPDGTPWRVGIADPDNPSDYIGFVSCSDKVVATSGGYERYFEKDGRRYIHIIDTQTGFPSDNGIASVTVISDSGTLSDALSTALFVKGLDGAREYHRDNPDFDYVILTADKKLYISEGIVNDFTLSESDRYEVVKN